MKIERIQPLMLAGGVGQRMWEITGGGRIPKCFLPIGKYNKAIDYIVEQLEKYGIRATWSADTYYYQYEEVLKGSEQRLLWQKPGGTTEAVCQPGGIVLVMAPDCIFPYQDILGMIKAYSPGTITWAVSCVILPGMEEYAGMDVLPNGAITGRSDKSIVRAPVLIADTSLLNEFRSKATGPDIFYDLLPAIERENAERVLNNQRSILNAYFLSGPVLDFGTPSRYFELTRNFGRFLDKLNGK